MPEFAKPGAREIGRAWIAPNARQEGVAIGQLYMGVCVCVLKRAPRFLVGFGGGTPQPDHQFGGSNLTKKTHLHVLGAVMYAPWHVLKADTEVICATMLLSQAATRRKYN